VELPDEEAYVIVGPLHPLPPQPPRWMGPIPPALSDATPEAFNVGGNVDMQVDRDAQARDEAVEEVAETQNIQPQAVVAFQRIQTDAPAPAPAVPQRNLQLTIRKERQPLIQDGNLVLNGSDFDDSSRTVSDNLPAPASVEKPKGKSVGAMLGSPSINLELPPPVQRKLFAEVSCFLSKVPIPNIMPFLSLCDIDPDLDVPIYFANHKDLVHLLCLMPPQFNDPEAENDMMEIIEEDEDEDVVEILRPDQFNSHKKRAKKLKESLPDDFLRRSKRQANKSGGFKGKSAVEILNPKPLAMMPAPPSPAPAPHLNRDIVEGIATGFL
jgi:hypothetical protein